MLLDPIVDMGLDLSNLIGIKSSTEQLIDNVRCQRFDCSGLMRNKIWNVEQLKYKAEILMFAACLRPYHFMKL